MTDAPEATTPARTPDVVFLDTETLGTRLDSAIWEVAAIRRDALTGAEQSLHIFVAHSFHAEYFDLPQSFRDDYDNRFDSQLALERPEAASAIYNFMTVPPGTPKPIVVGRVPSFDVYRISYQLLAPTGYREPWAYDTADISKLVLGYVNGARSVLFGLGPLGLATKADQLALEVGVDSKSYARHTAMGDCEWVKAQYDAIGMSADAVVA
ncbi:MAG: hypothetical protein E6R06_07245 [Mycobacterium sp.]|jgi:hypothetical protein|nr:MAG: hypothetical protein E6R06_07245 [Mycobacterium sp.]